MMAHRSRFSGVGDRKKFVEQVLAGNRIVEAHKPGRTVEQAIREYEKVMIPQQKLEQK